MYCSPSQNQDEFENLCANFGILLSQINNDFPISSIITADFNAQCSRWWRNDLTNFVGKEIVFLTSSAAYTQIIDKPSHVINNSKLCINLIFCTNQNVISKYGVDASLFDKCHHSIIYVLLPPVFIYKVWNYSKADIQNIQRAILGFNWRKAFESLSVNSKIDLLNEALLNILRNYIPNKVIFVNPLDVW